MLEGTLRSTTRSRASLACHDHHLLHQQHYHCNFWWTLTYTLFLLKTVSLYYDSIELEKEKPSLLLLLRLCSTIIISPSCSLLSMKIPFIYLYTKSTKEKIMENDFECDCHCKTGTPSYIVIIYCNAGCRYNK